MRYLQDFCIEKGDKELSFMDLSVRSKVHGSIEAFVNEIPDNKVKTYVIEIVSKMGAQAPSLDEIYRVALRDGKKRDPYEALMCATKLTALALRYVTSDEKTKTDGKEEGREGNENAERKEEGRRRNPIVRILYYIIVALGLGISVTVKLMVLAIIVASLLLLLPIKVLCIIPLLNVIILPFCIILDMFVMALKRVLGIK